MMNGLHVFTCVLVLFFPDHASLIIQTIYSILIVMAKLFPVKRLVHPSWFYPVHNNTRFSPVTTIANTLNTWREHELGVRVDRALMEVSHESLEAFHMS